MRFLSTPSARRATGKDAQLTKAVEDFYPRPPRGGRLSKRDTDEGSVLFLSTPSARRATHALRLHRGGLRISIHALREEGDLTKMVGARQHDNFYPRPPRGGRRRAWLSMLWSRYFYPRPPRGGRRGRLRFRCSPCLFLSTPSARRATAKTETKSLFSNKLYNILHEFRRALIYNGSKNYPNHAK